MAAQPSLPENHLAADMCDLGRLLLRMLLQARQTTIPHPRRGGHATRARTCRHEHRPRAVPLRAPLLA
eukprot:1092775-Prymnesium_polylepis.1